MNITTKLLVAVAAVTILGAGSLGAARYVSAQSGGSTPSAPAQNNKQQLKDGFLNHVATNLNVTVDQLKSALKTGGDQTVDDMLAQGKITQVQADKLKARIDSGKGLGLGFRAGMRKGARLANIRDGIVDSAAKALNMQPSDLKTELKSGKSIAAVATEKGVSLDTVKTQITSDAKAKLDAAVTAGKINQPREDTALKNLADRLDTILNKTHTPKAAATPAT